MTGSNRDQQRGRRVVALVRVSTEAQAAEGRMGLSAQRAAVEKIIADHSLDLGETIEMHHSGAKMLEEPRFLALLERVEASELYGVVVSDTDRLMRPESLADYAILEAFRKTDTKLITGTGVRDLAVDRLPMVLQTEFAAYEREAIRRRTQRAKEVLRRQGRKPEGGGLPRGVAYDHGSGKWSYAEPGASQVRAAFDLVLAGEASYAEISRQTGIPASSVPAVLRHSLYAGRYEVRHRYSGHERVERAPEEVIVRDVLDPPLIAPDDFERAQLMLRDRRRPGPRPRGLDAPSTYAEHLVCGQCGYRLWLVESRKAGKVYWQYGCGGRRSGRCDALQISAPQADAMLDALVPELLGTPEALEEIVLATMAIQQRRNPPERRRYGEQLAALHARRRRAQHAYEESLLRLDELREDLGEIDREVRRVERQQRAKSRKVELDDGVVRDLALTFGCWAFLPRANQRVVLRDFGVRMVVAVAGRRRKRAISVRSVALDTLQLERKAAVVPGSGHLATDSSDGIR